MHCILAFAGANAFSLLLPVFFRAKLSFLALTFSLIYHNFNLRRYLPYGDSKLLRWGDG